MKKILASVILVLFVISFAAVTSADENEISHAKTYSLVTPASSAYPDDGKKLVDGIFGTLPDGGAGYYASGAYVGFNQVDVNSEGNFVIVLDLGSVHDDISGFTIGFLNETSVGIYAPKSVTFSVCDDRNGEYSEVGTLDTEKDVSDGLSETFAETLACEDVSGRYVMVTLEHLGEFDTDAGDPKIAGWTFIDEIIVYSSGNSSGGVGDTSDNDSSAESVPESESEPESVPESVPESSAEESNEPDPPKPGDDSKSIFVFALLAVSAFTMMAALFVGKRKNRDF